MRDYGTSRGIQEFVLDTHSVSHGVRQRSFSVSSEGWGPKVSTNHMTVGVMPNLCRGVTFESERHPHVRAKFACDFPAVTRGIIPCLEMDCLGSCFMRPSLSRRCYDKVYCTWFKPLGSLQPTAYSMPQTQANVGTYLLY